MLDSLAGVSWFVTLDLKWGYHQVQINLGDRVKTAFTYDQGLKQFKDITFGSQNAPATFKRLMKIFVAGLQGSTAMVYLDGSSSFRSKSSVLATRLDRDPNVLSLKFTIGEQFSTFFLKVLRKR